MELNTVNSRPTTVYIYKKALQHNLSIVKKYAPNSKVMAVIKANAYGHGMIEVAKTIAGADGFAVSSINEAISLRKQGFLHRILLLGGIFSPEEIPVIYQYHLDTVVHNYEQLNFIGIFLKKNTNVSSLGIWIKLDTGMNRLGFLPDQILKIYDFINEFNKQINCVWMTHFATSDENLDFSYKQINCFNQSLNNNINKKFNYKKSLANSAAIQRLKEIHFDWVRPGIMLYGAGSKPLKSLYDSKTNECNNEYIKKNLELLPAMAFKSKIIALKPVLKGDAIGYGQKYKFSKSSLIATVAVGYGDGYPRQAPSGTPVFCMNNKLPIVGVVSMDMIAVDVTSIKHIVSIGTEVELWGENLSVDEVAKHCNTISYDLLCGISDRVSRITI